VISKAIAFASADAEIDVEFDDSESYQSEAERLNEICTALGFLKEAFPKHSNGLDGAVSVLKAQMERMEARAAELAPPDDESYEDPSAEAGEMFNIRELFVDL
jgi:hypothetical protein